MDWNPVIANFLGTLLIIGAFFRFFWGMLQKTFDQINERFNKIDEKLDDMKKDIKNIDNRLSRLEGESEERFRNEIKLFVRSKIKGDD